MTAPKYKTGSSNIIFSDYPDLDVIRVDNVYYMVSTTMHFMPGAVILRSYNLLDWEFCSYVYDELDGTEGQRLKNNKGIYGKGMWAACLRYHKGLFYVSFVCNDTHKTYLYTAKNIQGPWKKSEIEGFYHDMSILFDDDDRVYVVSGNTSISLIEMEKDLSKPKADGINKIIVEEEKDSFTLGYEGSHIYKINGKYYIFFIHMPKDKMRTQSCFVAQNIEGPYKGCDVLQSDLGGWNSGVAQGGIVQQNDGNWFSILFQDHGALGRIPVLVPVNFQNDFPVFGTAGKALDTVTVLDNNPEYCYQSLYTSDFTDDNGKLHNLWQWNHIPDLSLVNISKEWVSITTDKCVKNLAQASNILTQRTFQEKCQGSVTLDGSMLKNGDFSGFCALEGEYAFIGILKQQDIYKLVVANHKIPYSPWAMGVFDDEEPVFLYETKLDSPVVNLNLKFDLTRENQTVELSYKTDKLKDYKTPVTPVKLRYTLDHFTGVRFGLFIYSTVEAGGKAVFSNFNYKLW